MHIFTTFLLIALCAGISAAPGSEARLAAARAAPCSTAIGMYESIAADSTAPDSVRAQAFGLRADYAFALKEYETARDNYRKAFLLDPENIRYGYRCGLSILANGDTADAVKTILPLADQDGSAVANDARVLLGRLAFARRDYAGAMRYFRLTGDFSPTNGWSIAASAGKLLCARALSLTDTVAFYEKQLAPYTRSLLEKQELARVKPAAAVRKIAPETAALIPPMGDWGNNPATGIASDSGTAAFTLQVGAFAAEASALALKKRLEKSFNDVRSVSAIVSARTFYRVWVGNFKNRDAAEKFGKDELLPLGLVYRVVAN